MLKIISTEQFALPGSNNRFIHCATVHNTKNLKEYMFFYDTLFHKKYVEDITGGKLKEIDNNDEWQELVDYAFLHKLYPTAIIK